MASILSPNLFAEYQVHESAYTQHRDVLLGLGRGWSDSLKRVLRTRNKTTTCIFRQISCQ